MKWLNNHSWLFMAQTCRIGHFPKPKQKSTPSWSSEVGHAIFARAEFLSGWGTIGAWCGLRLEDRILQVYIRGSVSSFHRHVQCHAFWVFLMFGHQRIVEDQPCPHPFSPTQSPPFWQYSPVIFYNIYKSHFLIHLKEPISHTSRDFGRRSSSVPLALPQPRGLHAWRPICSAGPRGTPPRLPPSTAMPLPPPSFRRNYR